MKNVVSHAYCSHHSSAPDAPDVWVWINGDNTGLLVWKVRFHFFFFFISWACPCGVFAYQTPFPALVIAFQPALFSLPCCLPPFFSPWLTGRATVRSRLTRSLSGAPKKTSSTRKSSRPVLLPHLSIYPISQPSEATGLWPVSLQRTTTGRLRLQVSSSL